MTDLTIYTNNVPRNVLYGYELSPAEQAEFDYMDDINDGSFFRYKGQVYDLGEFMRVTDTMENCHGFKGWDGYHGDSYFSGVLVKYTDDCEQVIVGRWIC